MKPASLSKTEKIEDLAEKILHHKALYEAGHPEISDAEYDQLENKLRILAPEHPVLLAVGFEIDQQGNKVKHDVPMLSLNKTYDREDLLSWMDGREVIGTYKVDGVSISLIYENGRLIQAKTRGNGFIGEDATAKIMWVADIPQRLSLKKEIERLEVRGELYCTESRFLKLASEFLRLNLEQPSSPRNIVAGLLGRKSHLELMRFFNFFAFSVVDADRILGLTSELETLQWLEKLGFHLPSPALLKTPHEIDLYLSKVKAKLDEDEIGLDGAVFSYNQISLHRELGNTAHHPRAKLSFKWQGQTAISTIKDVVWSTSRLGIVTPVATINPIKLSGATISNVTLHNAAHVQLYNLKPGDRIEIVRSGEVIPKFLQVVETTPGSIKLPEECPSCNTKLIFDDVRLKCENSASCPAQQSGGILNWIIAAEIDDLSEKRLLPLILQGKVKSIPDLYRLQRDDLFCIPQVKDKMADKLFTNIMKSKILPLQKFLLGLGIESAGITTWEKLLTFFPNLDAIRSAKKSEIAAIDGFAEKSAQQITEGLKQRSALIDELISVGVTPTVVEKNVSGGSLSGKTFVITGELSKPRHEIEDLIKSAGGKITTSVSQQTYALVTNETQSQSSKMRKAQSLGTLILNEQALLMLIQESLHS